MDQQSQTQEFELTNVTFTEIDGQVYFETINGTPVIWDERTGDYVIRGKRKYTKRQPARPSRFKIFVSAFSTALQQANAQ